MWVRILQFGLRDTIMAPEQECQERYDANDERADRNTSYGRSVDTGLRGRDVDTGAVRLRGRS